MSRKMKDFILVIMLISWTTVGFSLQRECRNMEDCWDFNGTVLMNSSNTCCATGCCSNAQYDAQSCFFNFNCPRSKMDASMRYCCTNGCCTEAQYFSATCKNDTDCPGNNTENIRHYTKCCTSGCCSVYQYHLPKMCYDHADCPGRYGRRQDEFCCGRKCCDEETYDTDVQFCHDDNDCRYAKPHHVEDDAICCHGKCCKKSTKRKLIGICIGLSFAVFIVSLCVAGLCRRRKPSKRQDEHVHCECEPMNPPTKV